MFQVKSTTKTSQALSYHRPSFNPGVSTNASQTSPSDRSSSNPGVSQKVQGIIVAPAGSFPLFDPKHLMS